LLASDACARIAFWTKRFSPDNDSSGICLRVEPTCHLKSSFVILTKAELASFLEARSGQPHSLLGMHPCRRRGKSGVVVRALVQDALSCSVAPLDGGEELAMERIAEAGFFELFIPGREPFPYRLAVETGRRVLRHFFDPYAFPPTLSEQDLYLFGQGQERRIYEKLGAHPREFHDAPGVSFAVWAPNATRVSVVGNFNHWDGRFHPMRSLGVSGVWELFIPGLEEGELYKFEMVNARGSLSIKTDPYGCRFEPPPGNAAIVARHDRYSWEDHHWMARRVSGEPMDRPLAVYELHLGSWKRHAEGRHLTYRELAPLVADYVAELGFTHIELMPPAEHPFTGSWGYQVTGFFAPTYRFGSPDDFKFFVDHLHQRGLGVIVDWVPAHFPRDSFALAEFDGTHLYEHEDPRLGAHQDWGTLIFNYGRNEVRNFLVANALSWFDRFHIDGLRVDAVASMLYLDYSRQPGEWLPNRYGGRENLEAIEFLRETNDAVHQEFPGVLMIAEESTSWGGVTKPTSEGGLGFDLKWNMGLMHDTLSYFSKEPIHRKWHHHNLTFGMLYQYAENFITVFSHDEVSHGKASMLFKMGAWHIPEKAAQLRSLYGYIWAFPGKKLLFMGSEFGQSSEWNCNGELEWHLREYLDHEGIRILLRDLNRLVAEEPAFGRHDFDPQAFRWINCGDADASAISFLRSAPGTTDLFAVVGHFTPVERKAYRIGLPHGGAWREVINSNSAYYGGTGAGNNGAIRATAHPCDGYDYSAQILLPPHSLTIFKWEGGGT
jgi:1,4-alpha-glucan branching enzyme